jgi:hypothetical protein
MGSARAETVKDQAVRSSGRERAATLGFWRKLLAERPVLIENLHRPDSGVGWTAGAGIAA